MTKVDVEKCFVTDPNLVAAVLIRGAVRVRVVANSLLMELGDWRGLLCSQVGCRVCGGSRQREGVI